MRAEFAGDCGRDDDRAEEVAPKGRLPMAGRVVTQDVSHEEILRDFPYLEPEDIKAALFHAARQAGHAVLQPA